MTTDNDIGPHFLDCFVTRGRRTSGKVEKEEDIRTLTVHAAPSCGSWVQETGTPAALFDGPTSPCIATVAASRCDYSSSTLVVLDVQRLEVLIIVNLRRRRVASVLALRRRLPDRVITIAAADGV